MMNNMKPRRKNPFALRDVLGGEVLYSSRKLRRIWKKLSDKEKRMIDVLAPLERTNKT